MLNHKLGAVREKINSLFRLEAELADALRSCNRELRLKREIKHLKQSTHHGQWLKCEFLRRHHETLTWRELNGSQSLWGRMSSA
jgi:hypothetical protein